MPACAICGQELKVINSNHLSKHGMTLDDYIKAHGDPNKSTLGSPRSTPSPKAIKEKVSNAKTLPKRQEKTLEDLYALEEEIVVPDVFHWVDKTNAYILDDVIELIKLYKKVAIDTETTGLSMFDDRVTHIILTPYDKEYKYNILIPHYHVDRYDRVLPNLHSEE
jgi:uncharacterized protein YprB with RNaseH-like and TPR domain